MVVSQNVKINHANDSKQQTWVKSIIQGKWSGKSSGTIDDQSNDPESK